MYPKLASLKKKPPVNNNDGRTNNNAGNKAANQNVAKNNNNNAANVAVNSNTSSEPPRKQTRAQKFFEEGTDFFLSGFGSSFNGMGTAGSDLDLTLIYPPHFTVDLQDLLFKVRKMFFKSK